MLLEVRCATQVLLLQQKMLLHMITWLPLQTSNSRHSRFQLWYLRRCSTRKAYRVHRMQVSCSTNSVRSKSSNNRLSCSSGSNEAAAPSPPPGLITRNIVNVIAAAIAAATAIGRGHTLGKCEIEDLQLHYERLSPPFSAEA